MLMFEATCEECGHTTTSRTRGLAELGFRAHSCDTTRQRVERAARVAAQRASEGVRRDCEHKRADHQHGTALAYSLDLCRCRPCRDAIAAKNAARARKLAYGRPTSTRVPAGPVRDHVRALMAAGTGLKRITALSGVPRVTLSKLMYGVPSQGKPPRARVEGRVAAALLAVKAAPAAGAVVDSTGTVRRLQALVAVGYSGTDLARRLGMNASNFMPLLRGERSALGVTAEKVRALYDDLWDRPPVAATARAAATIRQSRELARSRGWVPPMAWDDDVIDDPSASPAVTVLRTRPARVGRPPRAHEVVEDVEELLRAGENWATVPARLGLNTAAMERNLYRAGRGDLVAALKTARERHGGPRVGRTRSA